jgi:hypothetical protein
MLFVRSHTPSFCLFIHLSLFADVKSNNLHDITSVISGHYVRKSPYHPLIICHEVCTHITDTQTNRTYQAQILSQKAAPNGHEKDDTL